MNNLPFYEPTLELDFVRNISVSMSPDLKSDRARVTIQVNDLIVHEENYLSLPFPITTATNLNSYLGWINRSRCRIRISDRYPQKTNYGSTESLTTIKD